MSKLMEIAGKSFMVQGMPIPARSSWRRVRHSSGARMTLYRRRMLRQAVRQPAHALETLRHAAAYLMDSRIFLVEEGNQKGEQDAVQVLMRLSRAVFQERVDGGRDW